MRDLLPPDSAQREAVSGRVIRTFTARGYDLVTTPPFEHAEVIDPGLKEAVRRDLLRFVEPYSGEVAVLRPDITPQIARIIATRLRDRPAPWRLSYRGTVVRQRRGRARRHRQIAQVGIEYVGDSDVSADAEVVTRAIEACNAVGLNGFRIELRHVGVGKSAIQHVPKPIRHEAIAALALKDAERLESLLKAAGVSSEERRAVIDLTALHGDLDVLERAQQMSGNAEMQSAVWTLKELCDRLQDVITPDRIGIDLGETAGQSYYTGASFVVLAAGPGEAIGAGGRYDDLLSRFGFPQPATGCGLDLDNLTWALETADSERWARPVRLLTVDPALASTTMELRSLGATVSELPRLSPDEARAYARAWSYDAIIQKVEGVEGRVEVQPTGEMNTKQFDSGPTTSHDVMLFLSSAGSSG
ncbi:MAG: ATP phosphoribosyltransferase regulatory subunit [Myxococcota bacterium]